MDLLPYFYALVCLNNLNATSMRTGPVRSLLNSQNTAKHRGGAQETIVEGKKQSRVCTRFLPTDGGLSSHQ